MKSIIEGKRYNTDTATIIGSAGYGGSRRDFEHWEADLYVTKSGRYFLAGSGGPMSQYSKSIGQNQWSGSERIDPLSVEDAFAWAQRHLSAEKVQEYFSTMIEDA